MTRRLVLVESPFSASTEAEFERNMRYLDACLLHAVQRGEAPFASHRFYPHFLSDADPAERRAGMECGWEIGHAFAAVRDWQVFHNNGGPTPGHVFYTDLGMSPGMKAALDVFDGRLEPEFRNLGDWESLLEGRVIKHITGA